MPHTNISEAPSQDFSPWLSVLIPSYEYSVGVDRILETLASQRPSGVECIVRDDSHSNDVQDMVEGHIRRQEVAHIEYVRSLNRKGAVDNWNSLLAMAKGEYILLMHHDEAPIGPDFFTALRSELSDDGGVDVLIVGCLIGQESGTHLRRHMPVSLQCLVLCAMGSGYLLRHNFIGPPSVFVIKRTACPSFDANLNWLVDVDWMNRAMQPAFLRCKFSRVLCVASLQRTDASITSTLKDNLQEIKRTELAHICSEQNVGRMEALLQPRNLREKCLVALDSAMWLAVKLATRLVITRTRNPFHMSRPGA